MTETDIPHVNGSRIVAPIEPDEAVPAQRAPADADGLTDEAWAEHFRRAAGLPQHDDEDELQDADPDEADDDDDLGEPVDLRGLLPEPIRAPRRFVVRHTRHVAVGAHVYAARRRDARSTARHERMMRIAETNGDHASALEWETRASAFRKERHSRRMALLRAPIYAAKAAVNLAALVGGALIALGLILAFTSHNPAEAGTPLRVAFRVIWWACWAVDVSWRPALAACPVLIVAGLWALGRAHAPLDHILYGEDGEGDVRELVPDESAILSALRNLNLGPMNKAVREGWRPRWVLGAVEDGAGWHCQLQLPQGVNVEMINGKKPLLASNLLRQPIEVWPSEPKNLPGVLDLWVAHPGTLSGKVAPWPLLTTGTADYFKGVPVAVSLRGQQITAPLFEKNFMIGGIMGTGKSSATRNLLLGAMLDPLVDIDVYVMASNSDYDPMRRRLRTLVKGDDDEDIEAALKALRKLRTEVTIRGQLLEEAGEMKVTRELARRNKRLRPRIVVFDECHELFEHKEYGPEAAELAVKVLKKARKLAITLVFVTVSPTATSIPKEITRNTSNRVAFAVGDHVANDGLLGTGKHKAGITATKLNPAEDIGTSMSIGFSKSAFEVLRWCLVDFSPERGVDEITPVVDRAMKAFGGEQVAALDPEPSEAAFDPIQDIAEILGDAPRMRTQDVLERLRALRPAAYREMDFPKLTGVLRDAGAEPHKSSGISTVDRGKVHAALANRAEDEPGESDDAIEDEPYGDEIE
jgi:DNA segregation ATPase FtsK/SpoIIIE, S-DNA-T family